MSAYKNAHNAVKRAWGPASLHACLFCGCTAADWAYDNSDPDAIEGDGGPYSLDVERYNPLCRSCHRAYDAACRRNGGRLSAAGFDRLMCEARGRISDERRQFDAGRRDTQIRLWLAWNGYGEPIDTGAA